jgi:M6 family metalloprotease-like protein
LGTCVVLAALLAGSVPARGAAALHRAEVVPLRPELVAQYRAAGKPSPELQFPGGVNKGRRFAAPDGEPLGQLTVPDTLKALVILVEFADTEGTYPASIFEEMILGTSYDPPGNYATLPDGSVVHGPTDRTLQNYFNEITYGGVSMTGTVVEWVKVDNPYSYYCSAEYPYWWGFGVYPRNVQGLVRDAVLELDEAGFNFSEFDTVDPYDRDEDGDYFEPDGWVDNLFIVHTGSGAEWTGQEDVIWSHSWDMTVDDYGNPVDEVIVDGVQIMDYSMEPEYGGDPTGPNGEVDEPFPPTVGVYAHEFGHVLGLPDEYDYGYESEGTGNWSVMAGGSWSYYPKLPSPYYWVFLGNSPPRPSAWGTYRIGFADPIPVPPEGLKNVTIPPIENEPVIYKIDVPFSNGTEYFLVENRQQIGFDQGMGRMGSQAHGLLIYHIDENVLLEDYGRPNEAECWRMNNANCTKPAWTGQTHYAISLEQADGRFELEKGKNGGNAGDPFPGALRNRTFSATSTPNSSSFYFWQGYSPVPGTSGVLITNIKENGQTITVDFGYEGQGTW